MLSVDQIKVLAKIGQLNIKLCDDIPIAIGSTLDRYIKFPIDDFKAAMGLEDMRFEWLLGRNNFVAGGAVLNWIWGEKKNEDTDFFFRTLESSTMFRLFITSIGFELVDSTHYADTYFERTAPAIIQVIGRDKDEQSSNFIAYGEPELIIKNFDLHICKFAIDHENLHTSARAIQDLLKMSVDLTGGQKDDERLLIKRLLKYSRKGFWLAPNTKRMMRLEIEPERKRSNIQIYPAKTW